MSPRLEPGTGSELRVDGGLCARVCMRVCGRRAALFVNGSGWPFSGTARSPGGKGRWARIRCPRSGFVDSAPDVGNWQGHGGCRLPVWDGVLDVLVFGNRVLPPDV